jgi:hypothetical protein
MIQYKVGASVHVPHYGHTVSSKRINNVESLCRKRLMKVQQIINPIKQSIIPPPSLISTSVGAKRQYVEDPSSASNRDV